MNRKRTPLLFFCWIIGLLCATMDSQAQAQPSELSGIWQSTRVMVEINHKGEGNASTLLAEGQDEFVEQLGIKSNVGEYRRDGTYTETYVGLKDAIIYQPSGTWSVEGDTFLVRQTQPAPLLHRFHLHQQGDRATFTGYVDWDQDGKQDDLFTGTSVKVAEEMATFYMVFLYRGPDRLPPGSQEAAELQAAHLANIRKLAAEGQLLLAGPFLDQEELRGIFILRAESLEAAQALTDSDPVMKAGSLRMEVRPWYGPAKLMDLFGQPLQDK